MQAQTVRISSGTISCKSVKLNSAVVLACSRSMVSDQWSVVSRQWTAPSYYPVPITHYSLLITFDLSPPRVAGLQFQPAGPGSDRWGAPVEPPHSPAAQRNRGTVWDRRRS